MVKLMVHGRVGAEYKSMYWSTSTSKMYEYKYIFLQCTQVRVFWKVLEYKYEYILNFLFVVGKHNKTFMNFIW